MIVSISLGIIVSSIGLPIPKPANEFLSLLGAAATPCALFAIGASLATKSAERVVVAGWLSFSKLVLHPAAVAFAALVMFPVDADDEDEDGKKIVKPKMEPWIYVPNLPRDTIKTVFF